MARLAQLPREPSISSVPSSLIALGSSTEVTSNASDTTRPTSASRSNTPSLTGKPKFSDRIDPSKLVSDESHVTLTSPSRHVSSGSPVVMPPRDAPSRSVSGETLVEDITQSKKNLLKAGIKALDVDWTLDEAPCEAVTGMGGDARNTRRTSRLGIVANAVISTASSLGKRSREAMVRGKDRLQALTEERGNHLKSCMADEEDPEEPPRKKTRTIVISKPNFTPATKSVIKSQQKSGRKRWLSSGLYVGQERDFDPRLTETKNKLKRASMKQADNAQKKFMPMPMWVGERIIANGRNFKLPYDVFSPLPSGQPRPDDWRKTQTNHFVGDAATEWKKHKPLPASRCLCTADDGCDDNCQNRFMLYECEDNNCNVGAGSCTNRSFAELKERSKSGKKYEIGVEVMKTAEKGFGIRACRTFEPQQIIVEYAGEIITQEECERRMRNEYKNNECYYFMTFDQNMIIDATRGSVARFINHSCEPNCRMIKWTVAGKPRMALFAGEEGIMTGEELTYDYNFDPFSQKNVQTCHCGSASCRGVLGPRPKDQPRFSPETAGGLVAGVKRKLNQFLNDSGPKKDDDISATKARSIITGGPPTRASAIRERISSPSTGASTLVEKEKRVSSGLWGGTARWSWETSKRVDEEDPYAALEGLRRRKLAGGLSRAASKLKRNVSKVDKGASPGRPARRAGPWAGAVKPFEPLTFGFEPKEEKVHAARDSPELDLSRAKKMTERAEGEVNRTNTTSSEESAGASVRQGGIRSVRGPRRAAALAKMGLGGVARKTMRVVEKDD